MASVQSAGIEAVLKDLETVLASHRPYRASETQDVPVELLSPRAAVERARAIYQARRERDAMFGAGEQLFGEPAWDLLLDLFVAHHSGNRVPVSSACIASSVPASTGLRSLAQLERYGLAARARDPRDARRSFVALTPRALDAMIRWLSAHK